ncbi:MAG TPA: sodium:proton antiporter [Phycisphaerales bacterium]|nr:sodium:proton antiporter [Phycisphaerales bacterium]HCD34241.1 sodium:proton antiporter [Phycisphaerales bacterium]|tara:strand:+ start:15 stop:1103 length:1089 start_codon:yes stop_codon:yes gene_type:complete
MSVTKEQVMEQLKTVMDPELGKDLVTLKMIKNVALCDGQAKITVELTTPACPMKDKISFDVKKAVTQLDGISMCEVEFTAQVQPSPQQQAKDSNPLPTVKHVIAVGAGKGGVGKSTVSVNLAVGLARAGAKVGLLDGDIYGPSLPTMLGLDGLETHTEGGNMIVPFDVHGIKSMTIGKLVDPDKPLIWRGPMAHGAFNQLATQTLWGELDYLIIDMPPGTGDVPLTLAQLLPLTGAVVVCTPQKVAQDDARRAVRMFQQLQVPILGVVENMSYFIGNDGVEYDIFGKGGAQAMAHQMDVPYLGGIPINMRLRANSDNGKPTANFEDDAQLGKELETVVKNLAGQVSIQTHQTEMATPTISIS